MTNKCKQTFKDYLKRRKDYPLSEGLYKLEEGLSNLKRLRDTLEEIQRRVRSGGGFRSGEALGSCMADERGPWMKSVPITIAETFGYDILPAVEALTGDGVPKAAVDNLAGQLRADISTHLDDCEAVRRPIAKSVKTEYDAMRAGQSALLEVVEQSIRMVECLIRAGQAKRKRQAE